MRQGCPREPASLDQLAQKEDERDLSAGEASGAAGPGMGARMLAGRTFAALSALGVSSCRCAPTLPETLALKG